MCYNINCKYIHFLTLVDLKLFYPLRPDTTVMPNTSRCFTGKCQGFAFECVSMTCQDQVFKVKYFYNYVYAQVSNVYMFVIYRYICM